MASSAVEQELQRLHDAAGGRLIPAAVVDAARHPQSPLHAHFEWDDTRAAAAHRIHQARRLIASVRVVHHREHVTVRSAVFIRDPTLPANEAGYVAVKRLRTNEDAARQAIVAEFQRAVAALHRARSLAVVLDMSAMLEDSIKSIDLMRAQAEAPALPAAQQ